MANTILTTSTPYRPQIWGKSLVSMLMDDVSMTYTGRWRPATTRGVSMIRRCPVVEVFYNKGKSRLYQEGMPVLVGPRGHVFLCGGGNGNKHKCVWTDTCLQHPCRYAAERDIAAARLRGDL